ncbi:MAG TPA: transposase, partial [Burkholderiales bacterium]|nr:transposase [Burkholderiales bacterium]
AQADIYLDEADRRIFLRILGSTIGRHSWLLHAFCLMGNHYHLLLETPQPNLSRGMRQLNGVYTQCFNRRHQRVGHVFQGRFTAILLERESYLLELARYVPLNPVRAGFVASAEQWPWSSYRATAGLEPAPPWLSIAAVLERFSPDPNRAGLRFREFVLAGLGAARPWSALRGQILGSEQFARRMLPQKVPSATSSEIPRRDRFAGRPQLASLLPQEGVGNRAQRNAAIVLAHRVHGYSLAEIARHLGLHYSTVSRVAQAADASIQDLTPA